MCAGREGAESLLVIEQARFLELLLQAFMWMAMEPPAAMSAAAIVRAKVELLRAVARARLEPAPLTPFKP